MLYDTLFIYRWSFTDCFHEVNYSCSMQKRASLWHVVEGFVPHLCGASGSQVWSKRHTGVE